MTASSKKQVSECRVGNLPTIGEKGVNMDSASLISDYQSRRQYFYNSINPNLNKVIADKINHCIFSTDLCMLIFEDFANASTNISEFLKKEHDENIALFKKCDEFIKTNSSVIDGVTSQNVKETLIEMQQAVLNSTKNTLNVKLQLFELNITLLEFMQNNIIFSLRKIFQEDNSEIVKAAIIVLLNGIIGLTEIGSFIIKIKKIIDVLNVKIKNLEAASKYLDSLDNYIILTNTWCIATELWVIYLKSLRGEAVNMTWEEAEKKVMERFNNLIELSKDKTTIVND